MTLVMRISYVLLEFPNLTQTFVRDEMRKLISNGVDVQVLANIPQKGFSTKPDSQWVDVPVHYFGSYISRKAKYFSLLYFIFHAPLRTLHAYRYYTSYESTNKDIDFLIILYLSRLALEHGTQHLHAHFSGLATEIALFISKTTNIPYSFTTHAYDIFVNPNQIEKKLTHAKFMATISQFNKNYITDKLVPNRVDLHSKIHIVHCGINTDLIRIRQPKATNNLFKIVCVGRLVEKKGIEFLIQACGLLLKKEIREFKCHIIGDGPLREKLESLTLSLGLDRHIKFIGSKDHHQTLQIMENSDVFALPCIQASNGDMDGIPVVLMESMAMGLPTISTPISGIPELLKGCGQLCEPESPESLSTEIEKIMLMSSDELREISDLCQSKIKADFSLDTETDKLRELFCTSGF